MCRAGGRRCPGQYDPAKAAARNARRRAQRAAAKAQGNGGGVAGGSGAVSKAGTGEESFGESVEKASKSTPSTHEAAMEKMHAEIAALPDRSKETRPAKKKVEETQEFSPLTDLKINNHYFHPDGIAMIQSMENVAMVLEARGQHAAANALRFGGRELVTVDSPVRSEVLAAYYRSQGAEAHGAGEASLGNAYFTLSDAASEVTRMDAAHRHVGTHMERHYIQGLNMLRDRFDKGEMRDYSSQAGWVRNDRMEREKSIAFYQGVTEKFSAGGSSYTAKEIMEGRSEQGERIPREQYGELVAQMNRSMEENSNVLTKAICPGGVAPHRVDLDEMDDDDLEFLDEVDNPEIYPEGEGHRGQEVEGAPGFVSLGAGAEHDVYLHQPTGLVYKVPWENSMMRQNNRDMTPEEVERLTQEAYAKIDDASLRENGVENVRTAFITSSASGKPHHLLIQPLYDPGDWEGIELNPIAQKRLREMGVEDLHGGNVKVNARTREIRLLDCLDINRLGLDA